MPNQKLCKCKEPHKMQFFGLKRYLCFDIAECCTFFVFPNTLCITVKNLVTIFHWVLVQSFLFGSLWLSNSAILLYFQRHYACSIWKKVAWTYWESIICLNRKSDWIDYFSFHYSYFTNRFFLQQLILTVFQMKAYFQTYEDLLKENLPKLWTHFHQNNLTSSLYIIDW